MVPAWFDPDQLAALDRWLLPEEEAPTPPAIEPRAAAWKAWVVMIAAPLLLTWQHYGFSHSRLPTLAGALAAIGLPALQDWMKGPDFTAQDLQLLELLVWSFGCLVTGLIVPSLLVAIVFRESPFDYGLRGSIGTRETGLAVIFLIVMVPIVFFMSDTEAFQSKYPFYRLAPGESLWPRWFIWEIGYALQFVAVEFLFRGFMVHGLRPQFAGFAVGIMTIPYCLIHFGKPWQETCAAVLAGLALGWLSLRTRSIWWGVLLHVSVAWSMDTLSLWRTGRLG